MSPSARSLRRGLPLAVLLQALIAAGDGLAMVALASRVYQRAGCAGSRLDPDEWFPMSPDVARARHQAARAIAVCVACPVRAFCLEYSNLSPYAVMEILNLNEPQQERFLKAYDIARRVMSEFKIYPTTEDERAALMELDEMERGYPRGRFVFG